MTVRPEYAKAVQDFLGFLDANGDGIPDDQQQAEQEPSDPEASFMASPGMTEHLTTPGKYADDLLMNGPSTAADGYRSGNPMKMLKGAALTAAAPVGYIAPMTGIGLMAGGMALDDAIPEAQAASGAVPEPVRNPSRIPAPAPEPPPQPERSGMSLFLDQAGSNIGNFFDGAGEVVSDISRWATTPDGFASFEDWAAKNGKTIPTAPVPPSAILAEHAAARGGAPSATNKRAMENYAIEKPAYDADMAALQGEYEADKKAFFGKPWNERYPGLSFLSYAVPAGLAAVAGARARMGHARDVRRLTKQIREADNAGAPVPQADRDMLAAVQSAPPSVLPYAGAMAAGGMTAKGLGDASDLSSLPPDSPARQRIARALAPFNDDGSIDFGAIRDVGAGYVSRAAAPLTAALATKGLGRLSPVEAQAARTAAGLPNVQAASARAKDAGKMRRIALGSRTSERVDNAFANAADNVANMVDVGPAPPRALPMPTSLPAVSRVADDAVEVAGPSRAVPARSSAPDMEASNGFQARPAVAAEPEIDLSSLRSVGGNRGAAPTAAPRPQSMPPPTAPAQPSSAAGAPSPAPAAQSSAPVAPPATTATTSASAGAGPATPSASVELPQASIDEIVSTLKPPASQPAAAPVASPPASSASSTSSGVYDGGAGTSLFRRGGTMPPTNAKRNVAQSAPPPQPAPVGPADNAFAGPPAPPAPPAATVSKPKPKPPRPPKPPKEKPVKYGQEHSDIVRPMVQKQLAQRGNQPWSTSPDGSRFMDFEEAMQREFVKRGVKVPAGAGEVAKRAKATSDELSRLQRAGYDISDPKQNRAAFDPKKGLLSTTAAGAAAGAGVTGNRDRLEEKRAMRRAPPGAVGYEKSTGRYRGADGQFISSP